MARTKNTKRPYCEWWVDAVGESWDTGCGNKFQFTDGGPTENGMAFCGYCGAPLKSVLYRPTCAPVKDQAP